MPPDLWGESGKRGASPYLVSLSRRQFFQSLAAQNTSGIFQVAQSLLSFQSGACHHADEKFFVLGADMGVISGQPANRRLMQWGQLQARH
jgi:hypothetical protein